VTANARLRATRARGAALARQARPALITGGAGDDPAGVMTHTVVGATTGFTQLWLLVVATPMLVAATSMAARVAIASGRGLAAVILERYGRAASLTIVLLLAVANVATIAADGAGVARVLEMMTGLPWELFLPVILLGLMQILRRAYRSAERVLTWLTFVLLAYAAAALVARPDWARVAEATFIPRVEPGRAWLVAALGLLGTTISPYMLFWQATEEVEHEHTTTGRRDDDASMWIGMVYSNLIAFFIVVAAATTIHARGETINDVADAARTLSPLGSFGHAAFFIGFVSAGLLALPVLAGSTAYAVAEVFGWREGLGARAAQARGFYVVLGGSLVVGALISLAPGFDPADALFYSQVLDGVLLPFVVLILLVLSNDRRVTGTHRNPAWVNWVAGLTIVLVLAADFVALLGD
jgi:Mn2+/Fe2+ NRAMP family transporter